MEKVIGIDPDASSFVCALVDGERPGQVNKRFAVSENGLKQFIRWVNQESPCIVALEGIHGQSVPIERALRAAGIVFYSFKPADTDKYRKAVLGQNKNNERDAEAVARFALGLQTQGRLERFRRVWQRNVDLQLLTRRYAGVVQQTTAETNRLWKLLRQASPDLYLALGGKLKEVDYPPKMIKNEGLLTLLSTKSQIGEWKGLSEQELMQATGGGEYKGRREFVRQLLTVAGSFPHLSEAMTFVIKCSAQQLQRLKREQSELKRMLEEVSRSLLSVQSLEQKAGIGTITATGMIAEIIDIRRFPSQNNLAGYSGLGQVQHNTGERVSMRTSRMYNRRLTDFFMTAAVNVVHYDPASHLAAYHRSLLKKGMKPTEAVKRVARALVRVIYRQLMALVETDSQAGDGAKKEAESGVASGTSRGVKQRQSNTPLRPRKISTAHTAERVKKTRPAKGSARDTKTRRRVVEKTA